MAQDGAQVFGLGVKAVWMQTQVGVSMTPASSCLIPVIADCNDCLPVANPLLRADVTLYGLHLSADETQAGALLAFSKREEWLRKARCLSACILTSANGELAQLTKNLVISNQS